MGFLIPCLVCVCDSTVQDTSFCCCWYSRGGKKLGNFLLELLGNPIILPPLHSSLPHTPIKHSSWAQDPSDHLPQLFHILSYSYILPERGFLLSCSINLLCVFFLDLWKLAPCLHIICPSQGNHNPLHSQAGSYGAEAVGQMKLTCEWLKTDGHLRSLLVTQM